MDPLSFTASLIAVMQVAQSLIGVTYKYGKSVSNSSVEFKNLVDEIMALNGVIVGLKSIIEPGSGSEPTLYRTLTSLRGPMQDCEVQLSSLHKVLVTHQRTGTRLMKIRKRLTWPMKASETMAWIEKVEKYKSLFTLALTADQTIVNHQISKDVHEMKATQEEMRVAQEKRREEALDAKNIKEFKKIMLWLSPVRPRENHSVNQQLQQPGTGLWFTEGSDYQQWRSAENSFLWVHGMPGSGKTILSSIVIDDLIEQQRYTGVKHLFFYCDFRDKSKQRIDYIYGSLITQMIEERGHTGLPDEIRQLYDQLNSQRPSVRELYDLFKALILASPRVAVVIDALDECADARKLLNGLLEVQNTPGSNINILVTSRDELDIRLILKRVPTVSILPDVISKDIQLFVTGEIERRPRLERLGQDMKIEVITALTKNSNGMFRWTSCVLDLIEKHRTDKAMRKALGSLPPDLEETYDRILENISAIDEDRKLAQRVFNWLVLSCRPMVLDEVVEAIAVDIGASSLDEDSVLSRPEELIDICGNLVTIDHELQTVSLAHFSVKEYFLSKRIRNGASSSFSIFQETHLTLARVCLTYLTLEDFWTGPCKTVAELNTRLENYPFLCYAGRHWHTHAKDHRSIEDDEFISLIKLLFLPDSPAAPAFDAWAQIHFALMGKEKERKCEKEAEATKYLRDKGDDERYTRLLYACSMGLVSTVELLLKLGFNPKIVRTKDGEVLDAHNVPNTPLTAANDSLEIVKLLVGFGAPIDLPVGRQSTALSMACSEGNEIVAEYLISQGADVNIVAGIKGYTPLVAAIYGRSLECMDLCINSGANLGLVGPTALGYASMYTDTRIFIRLMEVGCGKTSILKTPEGATEFTMGKTNAYGLSLVSHACLPEMTQEILQRDWSAIVTDPDDFLMFIHAVWTVVLSDWNEGHHKSFRIMMRFAGDDFAQKHCAKFLETVCYAPRRRAIAPLLELCKGREFMLGRSVQLAASSGDLWILNRLIEHGADLNKKDSHGWTPIACATQYRHQKILDRLVKCGSNPTPLETAYPTAWKRQEKNPWKGYEEPRGIEWKNEQTEIEFQPDFKVHVDSETKGFLAYANHPVPYPAKSEYYYFEVEVLNRENTTTIIGLADSLSEVDHSDRILIVSPNQLLGYDLPTGFKNGTATYTTVSNSSLSAMVVGCAVNLASGIAFFTLNGEFLEGETWENVRGMLYPVVYMEGPGAHIKARFGIHGSFTSLDRYAHLAEEDQKRNFTIGKMYEHHDISDPRWGNAEFGDS